MSIYIKIRNVIIVPQKTLNSLFAGVGNEAMKALTYYNNENEANLAIVIKIENKCSDFKLYNHYINLKHGHCTCTAEPTIFPKQESVCVICNVRFSVLGIYGLLTYDIIHTTGSDSASKAVYKLVLLWSLRMREDNKFTAIGLYHGNDNQKHKKKARFGRNTDNPDDYGSDSYFFSEMSKGPYKNWFRRAHLPDPITLDGKDVGLPISIEGRLNGTSPFKWTVTISDSGSRSAM